MVLTIGQSPDVSAFQKGQSGGGNAYHLPVSVKFQLISPCWYSTVLHGVEANEWADAPTEFDEFVLDGGQLAGPAIPWS